MIIPIVFFTIAVFVIFYGMIGYPITLVILDKLLKPGMIKKNTDYEPTVTYMVVAHNEEKVIEDKLKNALEIDYPVDKLEILVTSDNSTDRTNSIVEDFIKKYPSRHIRLYVTKEHKGKTNAQNEAQKSVNSEILVMTDANSFVDKKAIRELVSSFVEDRIAYVCGKLVYKNGDSSLTSDSESTYWNLDLKMRDIESRIYSITAGNGAIYACRNKYYVDFPAIRCHDSAMPQYYVTKNMRSLFNPLAVAYEKAGEVDADEFKRKVRMNRGLHEAWRNSLRFMNVFKYGWFSLFYFGHRTCRYFLWLAHLMAFASTVMMALAGSICGTILTALQLLTILIVVIHLHNPFKNKLLRMIGYYGMTIAAQYVALWRIMHGTQKATWEKAESTR